MSQATQTQLSVTEFYKQLFDADAYAIETAKALEPTELNFDKTKNFSRYLEANCDCC